MDSQSCSKILRSGKRCKNKLKYGNYCGIHKDEHEGFPLLELPDDIIKRIVQCKIDLKDLQNFASVSPRIQFFIACHMEELIKYKLPLDYLLNYDVLLASANITQYYRERDSERKKWNYILFLAIGGLYKKFKHAGNKFHFDNCIITTYISKEWQIFRAKRSNSLVRVIFGINVKEMTPTRSYNRTFETTNIDEMEHFFWKQFL